MKVIRANERTIGVGARLDALTRLVTAAEDRLPSAALEPSRDVLRRAADRFGMSAEHTVVVLGGATGVGKSSLFNCLVGIGLSPVAVRRPTTTSAIACVWEADRLAEAKPLLDRLGVEERRQLTRDSALDRSAVRDALAGMVLVDLPDHDSAVREHQAEVDHAVAQADVLIWVTDPQKYADASWHDRYLKALVHHADVMMIVLNQIDRLPQEAVAECVADLARLVEEDGLTGVRVIPVSARTKEGVDELRRELTERVAGRRAAADRLAADVDRIAERLTPLLLPKANDEEPTQQHTGDEPAESAVPDEARAEAMEGLRAAAGVSSLADAVSRRMAARDQAAVSTPLRGLAALWERRARQAKNRPSSGRGNGRGGDGAANSRTLRDLIRLATEPLAAMPGPVPVDRAALDTVLSRLGEAMTEKLPEDWARTLRAQILATRSVLADRIDTALAACELDARSSGRKWPIRFAHAALLAMAAAGIGLLVGGGAAAPMWIGAVMIAAGLAGTWILDGMARAKQRRAAAAAGQIAVGRLSVELSAVAQDTLFAPISLELTRYQTALADFAVVRDH
ncbi:MAG TPA: GTP-binding protein [Actinocrinis sp.]|jgi:GTPase Era involved in 16S rRNA processing|uniref:GTP-binding protein n=1 Tax=Actinocrinis sp. TaxID=1920516 RepID=UPI002DDCDACD|nr:GTP-binding protein [Actinocrinis sp.]HEV3174241.1 GTP-binding protein [Actinocrinis sp.]